MKKNEVRPVSLGSRAAPAKNLRDPKNWPQSLQQFIKRSFARSNELNLNQELKSQFQLQLKKIIDKAIDEGKVEENDWSRQKLPIFDYSFKKLELMCNLDGVRRSASPQMSASPRQAASPMGPNNGVSMSLNAARAAPAKISMTVARPKSGVLAPSPLQAQPGAGSTTLREHKRPVPKEFKPVASAAALKKARAARFREDSSNNVASTAAPVERASPTAPLVGTCQTLEKNYLRLTSEPDPKMVRPLPVLKKTLRLLRTKYERDPDYNYLKNQLKSLRQDLTVQHIRNKFTIKAYEFHSKIAIEYKDLGEFNQCQSQLKQLYELPLGVLKNKYEFLGYRILYFIITRDSTALMSLRLKLLHEPGAEGNEFILLAFKIWDYTLTDNYHDFFHLVSQLEEMDKGTRDTGEVNDDDDNVSMNNLSHTKYYYFIKMIKDFILERQILTTFSILTESYKILSKAFLVAELFGNDEQAFADFVAAKQLAAFVEGDVFQFAKARADIKSLAAGTRKIDIKGQI